MPSDPSRLIMWTAGSSPIGQSAGAASLQACRRPARLAGGGGRAQRMASGASDRILVRGTVLTMDDARRRVDALWIQGDRIGAVGTEAEVRAAAPSDPEVV